MSESAVHSAPAPAARLDDESAAARWLRRALTIPLYLTLTALALALLPLLLPLAALADLARRKPFPLARLLLFLTGYLLCESVGLLAAFGAWLFSGVWAGASRERYARWNHALERAWARALLGLARRIYGLGLEVEGDEALLAPGPLVVFARHASVGDTILPAVLVAHAHDVRLRYVIKRELLWDPCLDVVGHRIPNAFVRRDSGRPEREIAVVARLATGLAPDEGVLVYPEGTRFSPAKRERVLARLARAGDPALLERARRLTHVLPPRLGGPLAILEAAPEADVVFLAHTGFEGTASFTEMRRGALTGRTIRVAFWRVPAAEIPRERGARVAWLYDQWERVDAWVRGHAPRPEAAP